MNETRRDDTTRPEPAADAIEAAAKALFDFEGERLYGDDVKWDKAVREGFSAVDYYRDMARAALQAALTAMKGAEGSE